MKKFNLLAIAMASCLALSAAVEAGEQRFVTVGTGGVTGVYYPAGGAICRLTNKGRKDHGIRCSVESTGGSVYNARAIRQGELDFGILQSDVQQAALSGTGKFKDDGPNPELRAVFSLHPEPMHIMTRADARIKSIKDFKGKRINVANRGSGEYVAGQRILKYAGVKQEDFALVTELKSSEQAAALCDDKIDASFWVAGLPNGAAQEATNTCDVKMLALQGTWLDKLLADFPSYSRATIPGGLYPGNDDDIPTFGPRATLVTSAQTPDDVVYALVKSVFDNLNSFKALHPAFGRLKEETMIRDGLTAKLHPGAVKYYKERGWM